MAGPPLQVKLRIELNRLLSVQSISGDVDDLLGFSGEDFLNSSVRLNDRIHPEDAVVAASLFSPDCKDSPGNVTLRVRHADGRIRVLHGQFKKESSPGGGLVLELVLEDVRNLIEPGDALLSANFKTLIEHTSDYVYVKNRNHVMLAASRTVASLTQSARDSSELVGKTDYDFHTEEVADIGYRLENQAMAEGQRVNYIQSLKAQDGIPHWIDNRKYPVNGPKGEIVGIFGVAPDITEYIEDKLKVSEGEESLREAQAIAGLGSFVLDIPAKIWKISPELDALLGIDAAYNRAFEGIWPLIHPDDRATIEERFKSYFRGERKAFDSEYRIIRHTDGAVRWVHTRGRLEVDAQGGPLALRGTVQDVTELKQAGAALREGKELMQMLIERAPVALAMFDREMRYLAVSRRWVRDFGFADKDVVGHSHYEINPDISEEWKEAHRRGLAGETLKADGDRYDRADGSVQWVRWEIVPWHAGDGGVGGIIIFAEDITERMRTEAALRESEDLLRLFIEHAPAALAMFDQEMRYLAASRRWMEMHSILDVEVVGRSQYEVFPEIPESWREEHRRGLAGERLPVDERQLVRANGAVQWVRREILPWRSGDGGVGGIIIFAEDITERMRTEAALRESQEQMQLFIGHAPVALAMFDREMRYLAVSRRWAEDHALKAEEILGRSHYEVNPEVPERWKETHRRGLAGETQRVDEDLWERDGGVMQWVRWQIIPWRGDSGKIGGIVMFYEDITERKLAEAALNESNALLQLFIDRAPAALAMFDREMRYLAVSRRWLEEYSLVDCDILGRSHYEIVPDIPERWKEAHRRGLAGETLRADEERFERADGTVQWIRWEVVPWRAGDGTVGGIVLFADDITAHKEAEERLRLAATVFTGASEGITITDASGTILDVNESFTRITGYSREEVLGQNPRLLKSGLQSKEFYENMWSALRREGRWSGEIWNRSKNGDIFAERLTINARRDARGKVQQYVAHFADITEIKERELQLEHMASFDALTGLPNRTLFIDRLRQAMAQEHRRQHSLAVAYFDLDGFKAINDRYGQSTGDGLLTAVAFRMKRVMREGDTLARLGGDEFAAVLLDLSDSKECTHALSRMLKAAGQEAQIGEFHVRVSASAGVAFYPQAEEVDADGLLRQAGQALYQAKLAGGNRYHRFDPGQDLLARSRHENLEHIRQALAARQFVLYYQPVVNVRAGEIVGAEALIRWQHPEQGLLPPGMFLPIIQNHPLSIEVGEWVLESALTQMETWKAQGLDLQVSVNVSAIELQQARFAERLRARLAAHPSIDPSRLELEVVETSALHDVVQSSQVLSACREIGVQIALDDFGTGYSSLAYLQRLPANILKIDQSFVRGLLDEPDSLTILEGMMGLAAAFRRQVVAEGVETVELGHMLLQMGCEFVQGYGIARPMPAEELRAWAAQWRPESRWTDVPAVHEDNRALLYASVEHRAWMGAFEAYLQGRRAAPPPLDAGQCRIGAWLNAERRSARGTLSAIQAIHLLHQELHKLATEIHDSQDGSRNAKGLKRMHQLQYLQEKCLKRLETLARTGNGKAGKNGLRGVGARDAFRAGVT